MPRSPSAASSVEIAGDDRRGFVAKAMAAVCGGIVTVFPLAAGLFTFADPWLRNSGKSGAASAAEKGRRIRIASLDALPDDGVPRQFPVIADRDDAWNHFPNEAIGAVYLRRTKGSDKVQAFNATCPHAGCFVAYKPDRQAYQCPCHTSAFEIDGKMIQPSPSPRDLDALATEVDESDGQKVIWVWYQDFYTGKAEKKAKT